MKFLPYDSKPVTRKAFQITEGMSIHNIDESLWAVSYGPEHDMEMVYFNAHEDPVVGGWVVRLTDTDTYYCSDAVFRERNVVPEIS
jgi:hypothetical protein